MQALYHTILPPSSIHHALYLPHFTPSTIYPFPQPSRFAARRAEQARNGSRNAEERWVVKVTGNLVVAGGSELRVFEVREQPVEHVESSKSTVGTIGDELDVNGMDFEQVPGVFKLPSPVDPYRTLRLHLVYTSSLHGIVTGLTSVRTMASLEDGLDRLLVGFREAKMSLLEWSAGEIITVSMHTYERCVQVVNGDLQGHTPLLRSDPGSRLAILTLPSNSFAMLPFVQDPTDIEGLLGLGPDGTAATSSPETEALIRAIPYMPSYVLPLERLSDRIKNVKDVVFLEGFNTPTVAILYEPVRTWVGRKETLSDTYALDVWTLDVVSQAYANLTTVRGLPSDCESLIACPSGIGGVLVSAGSSLFHVDQNGNVVGMSVNGWFSLTTGLGSTTANKANIDRSGESRMLELDGAKSVWVGTNDLLMILSDGRSFQIGVEIEGRSVSALKLGDRLEVELCRPKVLVRVGDLGIFVGCAVGNSLLVRTSMEAVNKDTASHEEENGLAGEEAKADVDMDLDEDLYGDSVIHADNEGKSNVNTYRKLRLRVCDQLHGIGHISDLVFGESSFEGSQGEAKPEMVALGGGGGRSTVNVFRQGLRERRRRMLEDVKADGPVWHLAERPQGDRDTSTRSSVIIANEADVSKLYALSDSDDLFLEEKATLPSSTVHASPWARGSATLRVTADALHIMDAEGGALLDLPLDLPEGSTVVSADACDPYVGLRTSEGHYNMMVDDSTDAALSLTPSGSLVDSKEEHIMLYRDTTGIFRTFEPGARNDQEARTTTGITAQNTTDRMQLTDDQMQRLQAAKPEFSAQDFKTTSAAARRDLCWVVAISKSGLLQVRSAEDMSVVFTADGLLDGSRNMIDDCELDHAGGRTTDDAMRDDEDDIKVESACLTQIGTSDVRPYLLVLISTGHLLMYEAQPRFTLDAVTSGNSRRSLAIRFRKVSAVSLHGSRLPRTVVGFGTAEGLHGAIISGSSPVWILGSNTEALRLVAHGEPVLDFALGTSIHPTSSALFRQGKELWSVDLDLDGSRPQLELTCNRTELERSYTNILFDSSSRHYLGVSALQTPFQVYSDECELIPGPTAPNLTLPSCERSCLELFEPDTWKVVDGYEFAENEVVCSIKNVRLEATSVASGYKEFIAVGTSVNRGEDLSGKGNTYIFEVVETVLGQAVEVEGLMTPPEEGSRPVSPHSRPHTLRLIVKEEGFAPVTCLAEVSGYLVQATGQKVFVKALDLEERLVSVAFLDLGVYLTDISVFKNLILLGDLVKSVWFVAFQEEPFKLEVISKEIVDCSIVTCDFMAAENKLGMMTTDREGSLRLLEFDPTHPASSNGERLVRKTEFGMGSRATGSLMAARRKNATSVPEVQLYYATEFGAITSVVPSKQARYKRLQLLQGQLVRGVQHFGGLNPRGHRHVANDATSRPLSKGILDGQLLNTFLTMPISKQKELTEPLGTNRETVLNDLMDLEGGSGDGGGWFWQG